MTWCTVRVEWLDVQDVEQGPGEATVGHGADKDPSHQWTHSGE